MTRILKDKIRIYGRMIKFSHTIFALPFALSAVALAFETHGFSVWALAWIFVAMVGARSAAMGFNRIVDARIDLKNARTANREIPSGLLSRRESWFFVLASALVFVLSAAMLSPLCFYLSFPVLVFLLFYSYTKRFTAWCHVFLGFAISLAPLGAFVAVTGTLSRGVVFLSLALLTYIAGFDILYSCQDIEFDRSEGLFSLPSRIGAPKALKISEGLHVATFLFFLATYYSFSMHPVFLVFLTAIGLLLAAEHYLVRPRDLTHVHMAFFHINSVISVLLLVGVLVQGIVK